MAAAFWLYSSQRALGRAGNQTTNMGEGRVGRDEHRPAVRGDYLPGVGAVLVARGIPVAAIAGVQAADADRREHLVGAAGATAVAGGGVSSRDVKQRQANHMARKKWETSGTSCGVLELD